MGGPGANRVATSVGVGPGSGSTFVGESSFGAESTSGAAGSADDAVGRVSTRVDLDCCSANGRSGSTFVGVRGVDGELTGGAKGSTDCVVARVSTRVGFGCCGSGVCDRAPSDASASGRPDTADGRTDGVADTGVDDCGTPSCDSVPAAPSTEAGRPDAAGGWSDGVADPGGDDGAASCERRDRAVAA